MLNNHLIEVYNVDSIHNGPIFEPQNYAQRPQNEYLSTYSGSVTAINPPKIGTTAPGFVYIMGRLNDSLVDVFNVDSMHNGLIFDPQNFCIVLYLLS